MRLSNSERLVGVLLVVLICCIVAMLLACGSAGVAP